MVLNQNYTPADYVADQLNKDLKRRIEFLTEPNHEIAVREATVWGLGKTGRGEGNIPVAVTKKGYIVSAFKDPSVRTGDTAVSIVSTKQVCDGVWNSCMFDRAFCADIARTIPYDVLRKYVTGLETELSADIEEYVRSTFNSSMNNINKSFRRERYNLFLSLKEIKEFPAQLDRDSIAGMNLTVVSEMMTRMVISEEDVKGNKKYLKRSQLEANPLIGEAIRDLIYKMAIETINKDRQEEEEEKVSKAQKDWDAVQALMHHTDISQ